MWSLLGVKLIIITILPSLQTKMAATYFLSINCQWLRKCLFLLLVSYPLKVSDQILSPIDSNFVLKDGSCSLYIWHDSIYSRIKCEPQWIPFTFEMSIFDNLGHWGFLDRDFSFSGRAKAVFEALDKQAQLLTHQMCEDN